MRCVLSRLTVVYAASILAILAHFVHASTDTCADLVGLPVTVQISGAESITIGFIDTCLCLAGISNFESTNFVAIAAETVAGTPATTASLANLINAHGLACTYPENALANCLASNPCSFTCSNGYSASPASNPTECICAAPNVVCNGVCVNPSSCGSSGGPKPSQGLTSPGRRSEITERRAVSTCRGQRMTACGVYGVQGWECVDTKSDLESCGGCMFPFGYHGATGVDCASLPGILDVSCRAGSCFIESCQPGYILEGNSRCLPATTQIVEDTIRLLIPTRRRITA